MWIKIRWSLANWGRGAGCWCPHGRGWDSPSPSPHCCQSFLHPPYHRRRGSQLSCRGCWSWRPEPWWRGWWRFRTCPPWWEHKAPALNPSLVMNGVILGYDDDGDHVPELGVKGVHEHVQPLWKTPKSGHKSTNSALSDCLISSEMLFYLSISDFQYFLKSVLHFFHICMFWFLGNQIV